MKIALPTSGNSPDSFIDTRFGRAQGFIIFDTETETFDLIENTQQLDAPQGAGIQAAQTIVNSGATVLIGGHCGPKAFKVLSHAGVKIYSTKNVTVKHALELYKKEELQLMANADVEGHWV